MTEQPYRLLVFGAHPDDCELKAGGLALLYKRRGWSVRFVSVTNGDAGHHQMRGESLAKRRKQETMQITDVFGIEYQILNNHDGALLPTLEARYEVIREIRRFQPDLILVHRPNDYHPDHRYTSQLVQDAAYMVTVPAIAPDVPHLLTNPVIMYLSDGFQKPYPFQPDVFVDISDVLQQKLEMCAYHESQFYEWLPYNGGYLEEVPTDEQQRRLWLYERLTQRFAREADTFRMLISQRIGGDLANSVKFVEAFETCEYGAPLTDDVRTRILPFSL